MAVKRPRTMFLINTRERATFIKNQNDHQKCISHINELKLYPSPHFFFKKNTQIIIGTTKENKSIWDLKKYIYVCI